MLIKNIKCNVCGAMCQDDTIRRFDITGMNHSFLEVFGVNLFIVNICELCLWPEDLPIPFIVTEKGRAESMRQVAKENGNA